MSTDIHRLQFCYGILASPKAAAVEFVNGTTLVGLLPEMRQMF
jgi:hypothetical protein